MGMRPALPGNKKQAAARMAALPVYKKEESRMAVLSAFQPTDNDGRLFNVSGSKPAVRL